MNNKAFTIKIIYDFKYNIMWRGMFMLAFITKTKYNNNNYNLQHTSTPAGLASSQIIIMRSQPSPQTCSAQSHEFITVILS